MRYFAPKPTIERWTNLIAGKQLRSLRACRREAGGYPNRENTCPGWWIQLDHREKIMKIFHRHLREETPRIGGLPNALYFRSAVNSFLRILKVED